jgi:circadian clock protein KaiC
LINQSQVDLVRTGVPGLDVVLNGGFIRGNSCLVEGAPGTGKTTLGIQILVNGAASFDEGGIILSFEEFPQQLYRDAAAFGWDLVALEREKKLKVVCTSPQALEKMASVTGGIWDEMIGEVKARRILVDSVTHFQRITSDPAQLRELLYRFLNGLKNRGLTTFLTKETTSRQGGPIAFEEYVVDAALVLSHDPSFPGRSIEIHKTRGREFLSGAHTVAIGAEGLTVYPNRPARFELPPSNDGRVPTGIEELDAMTMGGLFAGGSVFLCGKAGTGKTTLALQALYNGITKSKQKGLYITFEEFPEEVLRKGDKFGWDLRSLRQSGEFDIRFAPQTEVNVDEQIHRLDQALAETGAKRVVLDSLDVFFSAMPDRRRFREKLYFLTTIIRKHGAAGIFIGGVGHEEKGSLGKHGVEATLLDGVIALSSTDLQGRSKRLIQVYKIRNTEHVEGEYPFVIGPKGIQIFYTASSSGRHGTIASTSVDFSPLAGMLERPIPYGTAWHVLGDAGVGKTIFGAQYLMEGLRRGEKAVYVSCDEYPTKIRQDLQNFGFSIGVYQAAGELAFVNAYAPESEDRFPVHDRADANELIYVIRKAVETLGTPCRVLVDSVTSLGINYSPEDFTHLVHGKNRVLNHPEVTHLDLYISGALRDTVAVGLLNAYDVTVELFYSREEGAVPKRNIRLRKIRGGSFDPRPFPFEIRRKVGVTVDTAYYRK